jgi:hypothetical protein
MNIEALAAWFQRKQKPDVEVEGRESTRQRLQAEAARVGGLSIGAPG